MKGTLIVIEGLDGSGKATQTSHLFDTLAAEGYPVRKVSFPDYKSESSALVKMYLRGDFGSDPSDVNPYAASAFYAVDRYASFRRDWGAFYQSGGIVLADRYTTSNAVHQCAKLPEAEWDGFIRWLSDFEYEQMGIPAPDQILYLQVEPAVSQRLMEHRYAGDSGKKDIHERNEPYLNRARRAADYCADRLGWRTVACTRDGTMRTEEEIHHEVLDAVHLILREGSDTNV